MRGCGYGEGGGGRGGTMGGNRIESSTTSPVVDLELMSRESEAGGRERRVA